jgi:hypothetical protein
MKTIGKAIFFCSAIVVRLIKNPSAFRSRNKIVFFAISENNYLSVDPVFRQLSTNQAVMFGDRYFNKQTPIFIPTAIASVLAIFFFPRVLIDYFRMDVTAKASFKQSATDALMSYPFYYSSYLWFKWVKPKAIVVVNDHVYSTRILMFWAEKMRIPSFYIQHASVTEGFPILDMKHALLEGNDAREKYLKAGSDPSKISLIGIPKLDQHFTRINKGSVIRTLGVATNGLETLEQVFDLIVWIQHNFPDLDIYYRPHRFEYYGKRKPLLQDFLEKIKALKKPIRISSPFYQNVMDYLSELDCLIAGDSGIHLEAVWLNVTSIYFNNGGSFFDYYGFVKKNLVLHAKTRDELQNIIQQNRMDRAPVRHRAKHYCATINTEHDGKSSQLAAALLRQLV